MHYLCLLQIRMLTGSCYQASLKMVRDESQVATTISIAEVAYLSLIIIHERLVRLHDKLTSASKIGPSLFFHDFLPMTVVSGHVPVKVCFARSETISSCRWLSACSLVTCTFRRKGRTACMNLAKFLCRKAWPSVPAA